MQLDPGAQLCRLWLSISKLSCCLCVVLPFTDRPRGKRRSAAALNSLPPFSKKPTYQPPRWFCSANLELNQFLWPGTWGYSDGQPVSRILSIGGGELWMTAPFHKAAYGRGGVSLRGGQKGVLIRSSFSYYTSTTEGLQDRLRVT